MTDGVVVSLGGTQYTDFFTKTLTVQPNSYRIAAENACNATQFNQAGKNVAQLIRRARGGCRENLAVCFKRY